MGGELAGVRIRRHLWIAAQAACLLAFVGYRIGAAASIGPAVWQDSEAYKAVARSGLLSTQLWTGSRAPLVPLLMKVTGSYDAYGILQGVLGALAWAVLAYTVSQLVSASWRRPIVTAAVLGLGATPLVVMWDGSALSESPSLSVLALLCASGIWLVRRFSWLRLAAVGVSALAYCALRDADIWTIGLIGVVLLGFGVAGALQGLAVDPDGARARLTQNLRRARRPLAAGCVLLVVALVTGGAASASHRNQLYVEEAFAVRIFPYPDRVAWFASQGMPEAKAVDAQARTTSTSPGQAPIVSVDLTSPVWAPLRVWFQRDAVSSYTLYLATHPWYVLTAPFASPRLTFNDAHGDLSGYTPDGYALAGWVGWLFTPNRFVELAVALSAVVVAFARRTTRLMAWRFVALFGLVGLLSMLLAWHGEGQEVTRHMVEGNVEVRLGVLLALVVGLLARRPAPEQGEADGEPSDVADHDFASAPAEPMAPVGTAAP